VCRDSDDIKVLGLAIAANADYIVTGDKDLLVLESFQGIPILNPRSFSNVLHSGEK
jgi:predicted nucleic acid-binding protein